MLSTFTKLSFLIDKNWSKHQFFRMFFFLYNCNFCKFKICRLKDQVTKFKAKMCSFIFTAKGNKCISTFIWKCTSIQESRVCSLRILIITQIFFCEISYLKELSWAGNINIKEESCRKIFRFLNSSFELNYKMLEFFT